MKGYVWVVLIVVILLWLANLSAPLVYSKFVKAESMSGKVVDWGEFGNRFGAVNALFTGLAFAGVILTILHQREELKLQGQRLAEQERQLQAQNETLRKQNFENTFFQMIRLHNEILDAMDLKRHYGIPASGRDCFREFHKKLQEGYDRVSGRISHDQKQTLQRVYTAFYNGYQSVVGHYFRNMYHILKFVKGSGVIDKALYTNILRAQLSSYELGVLFYNCLLYEDFKHLVEEFAFLKNMDVRVLIDDRHRNLYAPRAFGEADK